MNRVTVAIGLFLLFILYSSLVYTKGTESLIALPKEETALVNEGKILFQEYNCISCHQVYGLGGYLGPELTTAYSDKNRGEGYMRALLGSGGQRMPNFHFSPKQIDAIIAYLKYVDSTATPIKAY
jgi:nitric oxide reductase subunit C